MSLSCSQDRHRTLKATWPLAARQGDAEALARGDDVPRDTAGEPTGEGQPETGPGAAVAAPRAAAAAGLEDRLALVVEDAGPVVLDEVCDRAVRLGDRDRDAAPPVAAGVLDHGLQDPLAEVAVDADP